jgi:hypothetical protein
MRMLQAYKTYVTPEVLSVVSVQNKVFKTEFLYNTVYISILKLCMEEFLCPYAYYNKSSLLLKEQSGHGSLKILPMII